VGVFWEEVTKARATAMVAEAQATRTVRMAQESVILLAFVRGEAS
jgi:hypothetical protein